MKRLDLAGKKVGELIVIGYSHSHIQPSGQKRAMWDVECSCGVRKKMSTGSLTSESTTSCGHVGAESRRKARFLPDNQAEKNYLYIAYQHSAKNRGIDFNLEKHEFLRVTQEDCFYCGEKPGNIRKSRAKCGNSYVYNGIDRLDNDLGYESSNIVACCMKCNYMKRDFSLKDFLSHLEKVVGHVKKRL
jgi:hypothetical protein